MHLHIYFNSIYSSQDLETSVPRLVPNSRWLDKEDVAYAHSEISSIKRKMKSCIFDSMDGTRMDLAQWNISDGKRRYTTIGFHAYEDGK